MNSFENMGTAMLLATEGEKQIAYLLINSVTRLASSVRKVFAKQPMSVKGA